MNWIEQVRCFQRLRKREVGKSGMMPQLTMQTESEKAVVLHAQAYESCRLSEKRI